MGEMRSLLRDRWSGGLLAVATAAFVLFQTMVSAYACVMAVAAPQRVFHVICHGAGGATVEVPAPGRGPQKAVQGCPCGALCGIGVAFAPSAPEIDLGAAYNKSPNVDLRVAHDDGDRRVPYPDEAPPFPTGPPLLSA